MLRTVVLGIIIIIIGLLVVIALSVAGDPPETLIEPTPAVACFTPGPPILGPQPGQPIFPGRRKESRA